MSGNKSILKKMDLFVRTPDKSQYWKRWILFVLYEKCVRSHVRTYVQIYVPDTDKIRILIMSGHKSKSQKMDLFVRT